jgi:anti-sigma B factor antagonist
MDSPGPREDMPPLQFVVSATPALIEIQIGGEVDLSNTAELRARLSATDLDGQGAVRLELGRLAFCDGTGAWLILEFIKRAERDGVRTTIGGAKPIIQRLLSFLADGERPIFD